MRIFRNRLICTLAAAAAVSALTAGTAMAQDTFVFSIPLPVTGNSPELHDQSYWRTVYPDQEIGIRVEEYGTDWTAPQAAVSLTGPVEGLPLLETCETGRIYCFTISIYNPLSQDLYGINSRCKISRDINRYFNHLTIVSIESPQLISLIVFIKGITYHTHIPITVQSCRQSINS